MIEDPDYNMDQDPLPAWMRAKRTIVQNWDAIEELNGNRQRTIERIRDFTELVSNFSERPISLVRINGAGNASNGRAC